MPGVHDGGSLAGNESSITSSTSSSVIGARRLISAERPCSSDVDDAPVRCSLDCPGSTTTLLRACGRSRAAPASRIRAARRAVPTTAHPSDAVGRTLHPALTRTVRAAEDPALGFDPVTDDAAAAVRALRRQFVDRTLEAVEGVRRACRAYLERLIVLVSADVASRHLALPGFEMQ